MFSIDQDNKIKLTKGDTAVFNCTVVDNTETIRIPVEGDVLTLSIDDTDFSKEANIDNGKYIFAIYGNETEQIESGVYYYRVVLNTADNEQYTIIQDAFIDLLGDGE